MSTKGTWRKERKEKERKGKRSNLTSGWNGEEEVEDAEQDKRLPRTTRTVDTDNGSDTETSAVATMTAAAGTAKEIGLSTGELPVRT